MSQSILGLLALILTQGTEPEILRWKPRLHPLLIHLLPR